jgi:glyoxylase-like metal-dependent hydrolase (beta-lactamase superfamily II)
MFSTLEATLKKMDVPLREITHGVATHYHMDHAGCAQDLKNTGMRLIVAEEQVAFIAPMKQYMKEADHYTDISPVGNLVVSCADSRALLATLGIDGEFVHTPGHSDDSITVLLDSGEAFTGDLTWPTFATEETMDAVNASWARLRERGAKMVYGGHGPSRAMPV